MKPVCVLDCYLDARGGAGNFAPAISPLPVRVTRPAHQPVDVRVSDIAAVVITGSAASIVAPPPWLPGVIDLVQAARREGVPVLGVCYGHQVIARSLAGAAGVRPAKNPEVGWFDVEVVKQDALFAGLPTRFRTFVSHLEEVTPELSAARDVRVLARTKRCATHAFRVAGEPTWGVQFHAEMALEEARDVVRGKAESRPDLGLNIDQVLARQTATEHLFRRIMGNFLAHL